MDQALNDRLRTRFQTLGGDNDGYLTVEDFDHEVNRILRATNVAKHTPRAQLLRCAYQTYWWALLDGLDRNEDGKVSYDEYAQIVHGMGKFKSFARARAEAVDRFTDLDGDGWITRDDYMAVMLAARFDEAAARASFDGMDTDRRDMIPAGRFAELIMEFYDTMGTAGVAQRLVPHARAS